MKREERIQWALWALALVANVLLFGWNLEKDTLAGWAGAGINLLALAMNVFTLHIILSNRRYARESRERLERMERSVRR